MHSIYSLMTNKHIIKLFLYLILTPLFVALFLALNNHFGWDLLSNQANSFSRLSSYIYAHYASALILALFTGIQIGSILNKDQISPHLLFNILLLLIIWLSYSSFGDFYGVLLVFCCWISSLLIDITLSSKNNFPDWLRVIKLKINWIVVIVLFFILSINR